jgi:hypothetical protein
LPPHAGQLAEDVNGSNVFVNGDGTIAMPADIMPTAIATPVGIVYDSDGSVTNALLGQGAGDSINCFTGAVFGGLDNFGTNTNFLHALVVMNGNCAQPSAHLPDVKYRLVRVLGRVLGLDWSQLNLNVITNVPPANHASGHAFISRYLSVIAERVDRPRRNCKRALDRASALDWRARQRPHRELQNY